MGLRNRFFVCGLLVFATAYCSPTPFQSKKYPGRSGFCLGICFQEFNSPFSLMTVGQVYQSMLNVTGLSNTATAQPEFAVRAPAFSESDSLNSVNGPLLLGTTALAGEICGKKADDEVPLAPGARRLFSDLDFSQSITQNGTARFQAAAARLSNIFLGRGMNMEESQLVAEFVTDFRVNATADDASQSMGLAIGLCTAMLSSFDAITY